MARRTRWPFVRPIGVAVCFTCAILACSGTRSSPAATIEFEVDRARLKIAFDGEAFRIGRGPVVEWVRRSATIVSAYYGQFPVPAVAVRIGAVDGAGVRGGHAAANPLPEIRVSLGREATDADLMHDWVMVHEMTHLALPEVDRRHSWLAEGLATYVEGIARVQAGNMTAAELWDETVASMPKGMPSDGDEGLDRTHTWGRTYWGGALFCLAADVAIREQTANRYGLQDAVRAIAVESGGMIVEWPVERVFRVGDTATGTTVLTDLYMQMRDRPEAPDLAALWTRLGIEVNDGHARLLTGTREAAVREAITRSPPPGVRGGQPQAAPPAAVPDQRASSRSIDRAPAPAIASQRNIAR